jgi:hypothetical protein
MAEKAEKKTDAGAERGAAAAEKKDSGGKSGSSGESGASGGGGGGAGGGLFAKTPVLLGGVMIIEAAVLFAGFKFLGGGSPRSASAAELVTESSEEHGEAATSGGHSESTSHGESAAPARGGGGGGSERRKVVELPVLEFKAPNKQSGRTFIYDVSIFAIVKADAEEKVKGTITDRKALIQDRVRTIMAQSDPEKLGGGSEPGLETLRRQVKYQLDEIIGEGMIEEVLVPRCIPFRTDY